MLCTDEDLGYVSGRTRFRAGQGFALDEAYRLSQLPLVAPGHPRVIASSHEPSYDMGRRERVFSLVLPVPPTLHETPAFRDLERELRLSALRDKIAWPMLERRRHRLHATVAPSLARGERLPEFPQGYRDALAALGPIAIEIRGLFSGGYNHGRIYLRIYPEKRGGESTVHLVQRALGRPQTDLYLVGLLNLIDDLDACQASFLADMIERWWQRPFMRLQVDQLWLIASYDDLVLDSQIIQTLPLIP
jgi:hypothetical protein